jgi:hypothetical protein
MFTQAIPLYPAKDIKEDPKEYTAGKTATPYPNAQIKIKSTRSE